MHKEHNNEFENTERKTSSSSPDEIISSSHTTEVKKIKKENTFWEIFKFTLIALLIVIPIRLYVAQPFIVSGASMEPTFNNGQYVIVDQLSYRIFKDPERGEVIIFRFPNNPSKFYIKRIIGLPGDTVTLRGKTVLISNDLNLDVFELTEPYLDEVKTRNDFLTTTLDEDEYFVLGDNRRASSDSRIWGVLPKNLIVGRALIRLLPFNTISILPGEYNY